MHGKPPLSSKDLDSLAADVARLSELFTRGREELPAAYLREERLRKAYAAYFVPANLAKIHLPLKELDRHPLGLLKKDKLSILDLGSGPGTAILGMLDYFSRMPEQPELQFTAVDRVKENLRDAEELHRVWLLKNNIKSSLRTIRGEIDQTVKLYGGHYDLIILSNSLNELFHADEHRIAKRSAFVQDIMKRLLAPDGSVIIIEPALHETSRDLIAVRDSLLVAGFHVYSPCLVQEPCPAFLNPKDWCHEDRPWDPPEIVKEIDRRIGLRKDSLKFSYVVLRKDAGSLSNCYQENVFRVVSEPLVSKGKIEFYLCGNGGRRIVARLDKDRTSLNREFELLQRGAIVKFENLIVQEKRFKAGTDTNVVILDL